MRIIRALFYALIPFDPSLRLFLLFALGHLHLQQRIQLFLGMPVRSTCPIRPREILPVVHREVQMMERMMRRSIDDMLQGMPRDHIRVVDEDTPKVDRDEKTKVQFAV